MNKRALTSAILAVLAFALVAVGGAPAQPRAVKPVVISITVKKGRPVGGIKRPQVKTGRVVRFVIRTDAGKELPPSSSRTPTRRARGRSRSRSPSTRT